MIKFANKPASVPALRKRPVLRVWTAAVLICLCAAGAQWVRTGYIQVRAPSKELRGFPRSLATWKGTDQELDEGTTDVLNAQSHFSRRYTDDRGNWISLHAAVWTSRDEVCSAAPHAPQQCYQAAGWQILHQERVQISTPAGELPITLCLMENQGGRIVTAHWYQLGEYRYTSQKEALSVLPHFWGRREWPAVLKVLLHTEAPDIATARLRVDDFAARVFEWTADVDLPPTATPASG